MNALASSVLRRKVTGCTVSGKSCAKGDAAEKMAGKPDRAYTTRKNRERSPDGGVCRPRAMTESSVTARHAAEISSSAQLHPTRAPSKSRTGRAASTRPSSSTTTSGRMNHTTIIRRPSPDADRNLDRLMSVKVPPGARTNYACGSPLLARRTRSTRRTTTRLAAGEKTVEDAMRLLKLVAERGDSVLLESSCGAGGAVRFSSKVGPVASATDARVGSPRDTRTTRTTSIKVLGREVSTVLPVDARMTTDEPVAPLNSTGGLRLPTLLKTTTDGSRSDEADYSGAGPGNTAGGKQTAYSKMKHDLQLRFRNAAHQAVWHRLLTNAEPRLQHIVDTIVALLFDRDGVRAADTCDENTTPPAPDKASALDLRDVSIELPPGASAAPAKPHQVQDAIPRLREEEHSLQQQLWRLQVSAARRELQRRWSALEERIAVDGDHIHKSTSSSSPATKSREEAEEDEELLAQEIAYQQVEEEVQSGVSLERVETAVEKVLIELEVAIDKMVREDLINSVRREHEELEQQVQEMERQIALQLEKLKRLNLLVDNDLDQAEDHSDVLSRGRVSVGIEEVVVDGEAAPGPAQSRKAAGAAALQKNDNIGDVDALLCRGEETSATAWSNPNVDINTSGGEREKQGPGRGLSASRAVANGAGGGTTGRAASRRQDVDVEDEVEGLKATTLVDRPSATHAGKVLEEQVQLSQESSGRQMTSFLDADRDQQRQEREGADILHEEPVVAAYATNCSFVVYVFADLGGALQRFTRCLQEQAAQSGCIRSVFRLRSSLLRVRVDAITPRNAENGNDDHDDDNVEAFQRLASLKHNLDPECSSSAAVRSRKSPSPPRPRPRRGRGNVMAIKSPSTSTSSLRRLTIRERYVPRGWSRNLGGCRPPAWDPKVPFHHIRGARLLHQRQEFSHTLFFSLTSFMDATGSSETTVLTSKMNMEELVLEQVLGMGKHIKHDAVTCAISSKSNAASPKEANDPGSPADDDDTTDRPSIKAVLNDLCLCITAVPSFDPLEDTTASTNHQHFLLPRDDDWPLVVAKDKTEPARRRDPECLGNVLLRGEREEHEERAEVDLAQPPFYSERNNNKRKVASSGASVSVGNHEPCAVLQLLLSVEHDVPALLTAAPTMNKADVDAQDYLPQLAEAVAKCLLIVDDGRLVAFQRLIHTETDDDMDAYAEKKAQTVQDELPSSRSPRIEGALPSPPGSERSGAAQELDSATDDDDMGGAYRLAPDLLIRIAKNPSGGADPNTGAVAVGAAKNYYNEVRPAQAPTFSFEELRVQHSGSKETYRFPVPLSVGSSFEATLRFQLMHPAYAYPMRDRDSNEQMLAATASHDQKSYDGVNLRDAAEDDVISVVHVALLAERIGPTALRVCVSSQHKNTPDDEQLHDVFCDHEAQLLSVPAQTVFLAVQPPSGFEVERTRLCRSYSTQLPHHGLALRPRRTGSTVPNTTSDGSIIFPGKSKVSVVAPFLRRRGCTTGVRQGRKTMISSAKRHMRLEFLYENETFGQVFSASSGGGHIARAEDARAARVSEKAEVETTCPRTQQNGGATATAPTANELQEHEGHDSECTVVDSPRSSLDEHECYFAFRPLLVTKNRQDATAKVQLPPDDQFLSGIGASTITTKTKWAGASTTPTHRAGEQTSDPLAEFRAGCFLLLHRKKSVAPQQQVVANAEVVLECWIFNDPALPSALWSINNLRVVVCLISSSPEHHEDHEDQIHNDHGLSYRYYHQLLLDDCLLEQWLKGSNMSVTSWGSVLEDQWLLCRSIFFGVRVERNYSKSLCRRGGRFLLQEVVLGPPSFSEAAAEKDWEHAPASPGALSACAPAIPFKRRNSIHVRGPERDRETATAGVGLECESGPASGFGKTSKADDLVPPAPGTFLYQSTSRIRGAKGKEAGPLVALHIGDREEEHTPPAAQGVEVERQAQEPRLLHRGAYVVHDHVCVLSVFRHGGASSVYHSACLHFPLASQFDTDLFFIAAHQGAAAVTSGKKSSSNCATQNYEAEDEVDYLLHQRLVVRKSSPIFMPEGSATACDCSEVETRAQLHADTAESFCLEFLPTADASIGPDCSRVVEASAAKITASSASSSKPSSSAASIPQEKNEALVSTSGPWRPSTSSSSAVRDTSADDPGTTADLADGVSAIGMGGARPEVLDVGPRATGKNSSTGELEQRNSSPGARLVGERTQKDPQDADENEYEDVGNGDEDVLLYSDEELLEGGSIQVQTAIFERQPDRLMLGGAVKGGRKLSGTTGSWLLNLRVSVTRKSLKVGVVTVEVLSTITEILDVHEPQLYAFLKHTSKTELLDVPSREEDLLENIAREARKGNLQAFLAKYNSYAEDLHGRP